MTHIIKRANAQKQQLTHYFTGKPCKYGHTSMRRTNDGKCMECDRVRNTEYRAENPDVVVNWRANNPGYASAKYHENIEVRTEQQREYYQANVDKIKQQSREWREANPDRVRENTRNWYAANPTYDKAYRQCNNTQMARYAVGWRKRYYTKRRAKLREWFQQIAVSYDLPANPNEHDVKYWLAGEIIKRTGWTVLKEVWLDDERTSRIDLMIPDQKIGIEIKMNNMYGNSIKSELQVDRYKQLLPGWEVFLVSIDGTIGITCDSLLEQLK